MKLNHRERRSEFAIWLCLIPGLTVSWRTHREYQQAHLTSVQNKSEPRALQTPTTKAAPTVAGHCLIGTALAVQLDKWRAPRPQGSRFALDQQFVAAAQRDPSPASHEGSRLVPASEALPHELLILRLERLDPHNQHRRVTGVTGRAFRLDPSRI
jgi:hypothetical protein